MHKKAIRLFSLILVPILIVSYVLIEYDKYLDCKIDTQYNNAVGRDYGVDARDQGIELLQHSAVADDLIILGSSELGSSVPQNPHNMFPNTQLNYNVDIIGRAYVQSLLDAIKVGALSDSFKGKKIVLVVSLQWFMGKDINSSGYKSNFSEMQFYKLMNNRNISDDIKKYVCERTTILAKDDSSLERPYLYAYLYKNSNILSDIALDFFKPYYYIRQKYLDLKDKYDSYKTIKQYEDSTVEDVLDINWDEEELKAQKMGETACINNDFYVADGYYTTYIEPKLNELKDCNSKVDLLKSKEFDDYKIFLEVCKQAGIEPYIIFMSTNGLYYDYTGLSRDDRIAYYDKIGEITASYGFDYLDLRDKEYEPYFFYDVMHLGWKGWLFVNEQITEHFS